MEAEISDSKSIAFIKLTDGCQSRLRQGIFPNYR